MSKRATSLAALLALALLVAGCGSSSGGSGGGNGTAGTVRSGGGVNGTSVGNCLNLEHDFLVRPGPASVDGQSPSGVNFTLRLYKTAAAARAAAAKKNRRTTALVENGVIDFRGNPSNSAGAPPPKISRVELANIKSCIDRAKSG